MRASERQSLARSALRKSIEVRRACGLDLESPICIWGVCDQLGLRVRFVELSFEGMYIRTSPPQVFICAFRPLPRRVFTAAHEVGHHVFGHGAQIDEISHTNEPGSYIDPDEFLVDVFAGFLLMPPLGVRRAFRIRGLSPAGSDPTDFYRVACSFGVGYSTLIDHMTLGLKMFGSDRREELLQWSPKRIRESVLANAGSDSLVIVDDHWSLPTIDVEIGHHILMPAGTVLEGAPVADITDSAERVVVRAVRPGIARASAHDGPWSAFVRVSRCNYLGLLQYRHLDDPEWENGETADGTD